MPGDDIRERRLQRLAKLERARAEADKQQASNSDNPSSEKATSSQQDANQTAQKRVEQTNTQSPKPAVAKPEQKPTDAKLGHNLSPNPESKSSSKQSTPKRLANADDKRISAKWLFDMKNGPDIALEEVEDLPQSLWAEIISDRPKPLSYVIEVFHRAMSVRNSKPDVVEPISPVIASMGYILASMNETEDLYENVSAAFLDCSLNDHLDCEFVEVLLEAIHDDEILTFYVIVHECVNLLRRLDFVAPKIVATFRVLEYVLEYPPAAEFASQLPDVPATLEPKDLVTTSLGGIMKLGAAPEGSIQLHSHQILLNAKEEELNNLMKNTEPITELLEGLQFKLVNKLIRQNETSRQLVLQWFKAISETNRGQMATQRQVNNVNSFQLMLNSFKVSLKLSEPFVQLGNSLSSPELSKQLSKINRDYFAYKQSFNISNETKVLAAENTPFNSQTRTEPALNFVTECFFLTAGFLHFGFHAAVQALNGFSSQRMEHITHAWTGFPADPRIQHLPSPIREAHLRKFANMVVVVKCEHAGVSALSHNIEFMGQTLRFAKFVMAFNAYASQDGPSHAIEVQVPWERDPPENYQSYPEFLLDGPIVSTSFIIRTSEFFRDPSVAGSNNELLFDTAIFFMSSPKVLHNPYLRSKFVEVVFFGGADVPLVSGSSIPGPMSTLFSSSDICRRFLMPALMSVFIDIERTGRSGQFYEKFTTRELVASVMQVLWRDPHYRLQLVGESKQNPDFFVRFIALSLNDATYLLDEALGKVSALKKSESGDAESAQSERDNEAGRGNNNGQNDQMQETEAITIDNNIPNEENDEDSPNASLESRIQSAERSAKNFSNLSRTTMTSLNTFTGTVPDIFATPEIIDRFAVMLNYNSAISVGPRCRESKVKNPSAIGFSPKEFLSNLIRVYLNLRDEPPFPKAIAKDERSYSASTMERALSILRKHNSMSPVDCDHFEALAAKTKEAWAEAQAEEEEFGDDVPDEYSDPLMYTLMENPVTLPTSKVNIDSSTIKTHSLSDPTDPFNRVPLKLEDVIPNDALRQEISEFKKQKKRQHARHNESSEE